MKESILEFLKCFQKDFLSSFLLPLIIAVLTIRFAYNRMVASIYRGAKSKEIEQLKDVISQIISLSSIVHHHQIMSEKYGKEHQTKKKKFNKKYTELVRSEKDPSQDVSFLDLRDISSFYYKKAITETEIYADKMHEMNVNINQAYLILDENKNDEEILKEAISDMDKNFEGENILELDSDTLNSWHRKIRTLTKEVIKKKLDEMKN